MACAGVLTGLKEQGYEFASAAGCSAGALVAALVASGMDADKILTKLQEVDLVKAAGKRRFPPISTYPIASLIPPEFSLYKKSGFPAAFCKLIGGDRELRELHLPFATAAVDINNLETLYYTSQSHGGMKLSEVLELAVAVPGLFPAITRESRMIVDGAFATQLNLSLCTLKEHSDIPVVITSHIHTSNRPPKSLHEYLARSIEASVAVHDKFAFGEASVDGGSLRAKLLPSLWWINIACPDIPYDKFDLSQKQKEALFKAGRDALRHSRIPYAGSSVTVPVTQSLPDDTKAAKIGNTIVNHFSGSFNSLHQTINMSDISSKVKVHGDGNIIASGSDARADHSRTEIQNDEVATLHKEETIPQLSRLIELLSRGQLASLSKSSSFEAASILSKLEEALQNSDVLQQKNSLISWKTWFQKLEDDSKKALALSADLVTIGIPLAKLLFGMIP